MVHTSSRLHLNSLKVAVLSLAILLAVSFSPSSIYAGERVPPTPLPYTEENPAPKYYLKIDDSSNGWIFVCESPTPEVNVGGSTVNMTYPYPCQFGFNTNVGTDWELRALTSPVLFSSSALISGPVNLIWNESYTSMFATYSASWNSSPFEPYSEIYTGISSSPAFSNYRADVLSTETMTTGVSGLFDDVPVALVGGIGVLAVLFGIRFALKFFKGSIV